jgi:hypothetical protein
MDSAKLLIIGGVALGGFYLFNKSKKDRENSQILVLQNTQPQTATLSQLELESKPNGKEIVTPKEATVYATKTIAEVNSLMVKYPLLTKQEFVDNYNSSYKTDLIIDTDGNIVAKKSTVTPPIIQGNGLQGLVNQLVIIRTLDGTASNVNNTFKSQQMIYARWKSDFSTVYSDLKNYYSTLTKEQADFIIKYLPKMIIKAFMGDNDPRVRANDFYSQEEIIDFIDNSFVKDEDKLLEFALGNFFRNYQMSIGAYSGIKTAIGTKTPIYN